MTLCRRGEDVWLNREPRPSARAWGWGGGVAEDGEWVRMAREVGWAVVGQ